MMEQNDYGKNQEDYERFPRADLTPPQPPQWTPAEIELLQGLRKPNDHCVPVTLYDSSIVDERNEKKDQSAPPTLNESADKNIGPLETVPDGFLEKQIPLEERDRRRIAGALDAIKDGLGPFNTEEKLADVKSLVERLENARVSKVDIASLLWSAAYPGQFKGNLNERLETLQKHCQTHVIPQVQDASSRMAKAFFQAIEQGEQPADYSEYMKLGCPLTAINQARLAKSTGRNPTLVLENALKQQDEKRSRIDSEGDKHRDISSTIYRLGTEKATKEFIDDIVRISKPSHSEEKSLDILKATQKTLAGNGWNHDEIALMFGRMSKQGQSAVIEEVGNLEKAFKWVSDFKAYLKEKNGETLQHSDLADTLEELGVGKRCKNLDEAAFVLLGNIFNKISIPAKMIGDAVDGKPPDFKDFIPKIPVLVEEHELVPLKEPPIPKLKGLGSSAVLSILASDNQGRKR
jgi:hypothetical protein